VAAKRRRRGDASSSPGYTELERLAEQHGREAFIDTVKTWLGDSEGAPRVRRRRGRPKGKPYYDDAPLLQAAAAQWRQTPGACVWPYLIEAGGGTSGACRLLRRLDEWDLDGCTERGIADFYLVRWRERVERHFIRTHRYADLLAYLLTRGSDRQPVDRADMRALLLEIVSMPLPVLTPLMQKGAQIAAACRTWEDLVGGVCSFRAAIFATYKISDKPADYLSVELEPHPPLR
jgi:hypothetical protein